MIIKIKNKIDEIPILNDLLRKISISEGVKENIINEVLLAVEETVVNIINYGFNENEQSEITINLEFTGKDLIIKIKDGGREFDPTEMKEISVSDSLEERSIGGLGLFLIKNLMDYMEYHRIDDKNVLILKKFKVK